jgi:hypothetical protein
MRRAQVSSGDDLKRLLADPVTIRLFVPRCTPATDVRDRVEAELTGRAAAPTCRYAQRRARKRLGRGRGPLGERK